MEKYINALNEAYSHIMKDCNSIFLQDHSKDTLLDSRNIINNGIKLLSILKTHTKSIKSIIDDCDEFVDEIEKELSFPQPEEDFVYNTTNGMLSYKEKDHIISSKKNTKEQTQPIIHKQRMPFQVINYQMEMPVVNNLKDIPMMFAYYNNTNDKQNQPGVYCCIYDGVYVRVPFPEIVDTTRNYSRVGSIRCKYETQDLCKEQRMKMAKYHDSDLRSCNFAHKGDKLVKMGYASRCPLVPRFGDPATITNDIKHVTKNDIRSLLLYSINDAALASIWYSYHGEKNEIITNLDYV